ncbi:MAG: YihY/virulence factor BrkB family protein [Syntrophobacteraceae bacterium]|nr:YihY/virulence factor BrkB family protein [Syntrophobacteraceae bacterium]
MNGAPITRFLKDLHNEVSDHNVYSGAAALAFYMILSIFPAAIVLLTLLPYLPIPHLDKAVLDLIGQVLPQQSATLFTGVVKQVTSQRHGGLLSFGLLFLLWSGSSGLYAIMQQLNISYDVKERRPFWKVRGTALILMVLFFILVVGGFGLIVSGGLIQGWVGNLIGWNKPLLIFFALFRWAIIAVFLLTAFAIIYYFGPDVEQKFRFISPGSLLGVVLLVLASLGFRVYVASFSNYSATYGSLGALIVLLMWLYIGGLVILVGSEVNALLEHRRPGAACRRRRVAKPRSARLAAPAAARTAARTACRVRKHPGRPNSHFKSIPPNMN